MKTKKPYLILSALLILIVVGVLYQLKGEEQDTQETEVDERARENREQLAALYQAPRETLPSQGIEGSPECIEFWGALRGLDLSRQQEEFPDIKEATHSDKCKVVPAQLKNLHDHFNQTCISKKDTSACLIALYYYRAALTDFLTRNQNPDQIQDPKILIDKILANREINPLLSVKAAERLSELQPSLYEARKAQVLGRLFMLSKAPQESNEQVWRDLEDSIGKAREMGETDPELLEAELLSELFRPNNSARLQERAKEITDEFPNEWRGPYYTAWALFKDGRGQEALDFLMEAQRRDPENKRIREAAEGIKKGDANPFRGDISFSDLSQYF